MPDYYMVLSEAVLNVFTAFDNDHEDDKELRQKAMHCLNNMKWAMIRAEQWEEEYDEYITKRLEQAGYHDCHLRSWGVTDRPNDEPSNLALSNDFTEDIRRHATNTEKVDVVIQYHWIEDVFDARNYQTPGDFRDWQAKLSSSCLQHNPSDSLKALVKLDKIEDVPVHRIVFNAAFYAIWKEPKPYRDHASDGSQIISTPEDQIAKYRPHIITGLTKIIESEGSPREVQSFFLDLAQFIEHCDAEKESLSSFGASLSAFGGVDGIEKLGNCAERIAAYAKALHYREMEFLYQNTKPIGDHIKKTTIAESLIQIFKKLGVQEAAEGVLEYAKNNEIMVSAQWYEKLNQWDEAKALYRGDDDNSSLTSQNQLGYMRCLEALGEWDNLAEETRTFQTDDDKEKVDSAKLGTFAAWHREDWDTFSKLMAIVPNDSFDGAFYRAAFNVQNQNYSNARKFIKMARRTLESELTMLVPESYNRAYNAIFNAQLLSELEEVMEQKGADRNRQIQIYHMWETRLIGDTHVFPHKTVKLGM